MPRFSLRTPMIVMLLAPPLPAGIWTYWQRWENANEKKPVAIDLRLTTGPTSED